MAMSYLETKGRIFDLQKFSVHDGPGIRTIVFLKGCALRCKWCCNPESQEHAIQNLKIGGKNTVCGRDVTVSEVIDEVKKDMPYYRRSGGGLTLSGGESLCQPDFAANLLRAAKENAINTAMESTGYAEISVIDRILENLDWFLMDIKHIDSKKHEKFTTKPNDKILKNARYIAEHAKNLIIRVPVIPTFNDTVEEITQISEFAASLPNVNKIHLLPYHRLGLDKYEGLGRSYELMDILPPTDEQMEILKHAAQKSGLTCQIGG